ncbi:archaeal DNA polymerase II, large subunit [Candidatus Scalindua japonica]|uniref:Archaeal DNA polymerase II, large subunit n=1 Tax=Candidatus Scalindua japonica TaxID=1284222 RepID=A0A286U2N5_9BACT|nr:hypothetical protein [Candidatus Scalindua japonica]GAX62331.1 archaeal DNA polymerase II, large subunit [Candidatus Scalindua japonica]
MKNVSDYSKPNSKKVKLKGESKAGIIKGAISKQKRICLKCGEKFPSKGPYNRICDKCSSTNERVASSTYAVRNSTPSEPNTLEKRFYGQN